MWNCLDSETEEIPSQVSLDLNYSMETTVKTHDNKKQIGLGKIKEM